METEPSAGESQQRDADLVTLEGLEAEFTDLEAELTRVEQSRGPSPDAAAGEGPNEQP